MSARDATEGAAVRDDALRARVREYDWYHSIELAPGLVTEGTFDHRPYVDRYGLPGDLSGRRALDVGTFDGFWAFELERRGARVDALDDVVAARHAHLAGHGALRRIRGSACPLPLPPALPRPAARGAARGDPS